MSERLGDCACGCNAPVMYRGGRPGKFASTACRMRAHRAQRRDAVELPRALRGHDRWVRHSAKKVPLTHDNWPASSTDPLTWCSYSIAAASEVGAGLGFVLNGDGIVCIDLDHCLIEGVPSVPAQALLDRLPAGTFVETSRSGTGLHVWGRASLPGTGRKVTTPDGLSVEVYGMGRFIALGTPRSGFRLGDLSGVVAQLI